VTRLDLVVGPNGAGKTTFVTRVLAPELPESVFVDADVIAAQEWPTDPGAHAYEAAAIAAQVRALCLAQDRAFIAETVCSHPSKVDLVDDAHAAGFFVALHVVMIPEDLAVARVAQRVEAGGHDVPEEKVRSRWHRLWANVARAAERADDASFYDNSRLGGPELVGHLLGGRPRGPLAWPSWTHPDLADRTGTGQRRRHQPAGRRGVGVTIDDARAVVADLPRSYEALVHDEVRFRVKGMVYAAFYDDDTIMGVAFPKEEREGLVESEPEKFLLPRTSDMRFNWICVRLDALDQEELRELLVDAWRMCVPGRVAAAYEG
jgi:predicted ABC-type ATPase